MFTSLLAHPKIKHVFLGLLATTLVVVFLSLRLHANNPQDAASRQPHPIEVVTVNLQDSYMRERSFTGRVTAAQVSQIGFELNGIIKDVLVDDGFKVTAGQALASLDTARLHTQRNQLLAKKEEIDANLTLATNRYNRTKTLKDGGHVSDQRLDDARNALESVQAIEKSIDASLRANAIELEKSTVRAPFDGLIARRFMDEGTVVSAGMPLFEIVGSGLMEAKIGVTPDVAESLKNGASYRIVNGRRQTIEGTLINIVSAIRAKTRTQIATFALKENMAQDGELATVLIMNAVPIRGAWLPTRALNADVRGLWRVYKVVEDKGVKKVRFENVQVLHSTKDRVFVSGSIKNGDQIVAGGVSRLALDQVVTIQRTSTNVEN